MQRKAVQFDIINRKNTTKNELVNSRMKQHLFVIQQQPTKITKTCSWHFSLRFQQKQPSSTYTSSSHTLHRLQRKNSSVKLSKTKLQKKKIIILREHRIIRNVTFENIEEKKKSFTQSQLTANGKSFNKNIYKKTTLPTQAHYT